ncbi:DUF2971 domain-containing protein [Aureibaculum sp. 2210JD6-5]|uniref:DUF2971 domain-containing protein n=1 Tax=Aureibaculum sp. 2210JD6-5 TaxID=3103957 RepID=UPI002AAE6CF4|nr:DUF2971 domain-containing protein [Aureibaculum sp. 2210JD6-5]MDY7396875.1 DUF2971 domain-containing protein [Aureibaculum sp. 2210JD6-5]
MNIKFFKNLYKEDIIYHYTKASTAIDFILHNNQLKFNRAKNSTDPIESKESRRGTVSSINGEYDGYKAEELHVFIGDLEKQFNQICFCQNYMGEDFANENYITNFKGNEEIFGFTKFRMWDQYADKFKGVCLAFSKEKILSLNKNKLEIIDENIKYVTFQELWEKKIGHIQGDHLQNIGKEKYKDQLEKTVKESFFYKHLDYSGENEYRIGTLFDKNKCSIEKIQDEFVFDKSMMLDISDCIEAIFISSYANDKQKSDLLGYANKLNVKIIEMKWKYDSFEPIDYKLSSEFF